MDTQYSEMVSEDPQIQSHQWVLSTSISISGGGTLFKSSFIKQRLNKFLKFYGSKIFYHSKILWNTNVRGALKIQEIYYTMCNESAPSASIHNTNIDVKIEEP